MTTISGLRVIIAGGASGVGAATAKLLASQGARVIVGDINLAGAKQVVEGITASGGTATASEFDLGEEQSIKSLISNGVDTLGGLDGLVNIGAAIHHSHLSRDVGVDEMDADIWRTTMNVNLIGYALTAKYALPHFKRNGSGSIINTSAAAAFLGEPLYPAYASSKAGIHALTRHIARTWGPQNIRANALALGLTNTGPLKKSLAESPALRSSIGNTIPLKRTAEPEEVASLILYLLSREAAYVTGQVWSVNGGLALRE